MISIIACNEKNLLSQDDIDLHRGLQHWWAQATQMREEHRTTERLRLMQQINFQSKLSKQLPIASFRVVYNKSGMHICAAKLRDRRALVTHGLYWAQVSSEAKADYLCGILNAPVTTELTRPLMSYGKDERDIHKHVWKLPIPQFDPANDTHTRIVMISRTLESIVASDFTIDESVHFAATRRHIRDPTNPHDRVGDV